MPRLAVWLAIGLILSVTPVYAGSRSVVWGCFAWLGKLPPFSWLQDEGLTRLPVDSSKETLRALRETAGDAWVNDLILLAKTLHQPPQPNTLSFPEAISKELSGAKLTPFDLPVVARKMEELLKRDYVDLSLPQKSDFREVLNELALKSLEESSDPTAADVFKAFEKLVREMRPNHTPPSELGPTSRERGIFAVRWEKRMGEVFRGKESVVRDERGRFLSWDNNPSSFDLSSAVKSGKLNIQDGRYLYVIDRTGNIVLAPFRPEWPHPTLLGGRDPKVIGAGELVILDGQLALVDDGSGHFKPQNALEKTAAAFRKVLPAESFHPNFAGFLPVRESVDFHIDYDKKTVAKRVNTR